MPCRSCWASFTPNAVHGTKPLSPKKFSAVSKEISMNADLQDVVREKYGQAALRVVNGQGNGCCGASLLDGCDPITSDLYDAEQAGELPEKAVAASLGCSNPTALAELKSGE